MILRTMLALCVLGVAAATVARAAEKAGGAASTDVFPYKVHQTTLDNGLKVVVIPFDSPGTVAYFTVVRTGSRDEVEAGHSGFAHFFEHMMFRGTEKYSKDAYGEKLKGMGADSNAFTDDDYTNYYIVGPKSELETMMDMESDRFKNLKYAEPAFRTEALAVLGEYNKSASSPSLPMFEKMLDLAFQKHTYKHTTIGFLDDVKAMPGYYEYSLGFFDRFYRPENATVLIVGDVQPQPTIELARRYYGDWKKGYKAPTVTAEPPQTEAKKAHLDWPNPVRPQLLMGYHAPAFSTAKVDSAAIDLLGQLLFADSAPLYQELVVDKQWVDSLSGGLQQHRDPYPFTIYAQVKSDDLVPKVQQAIADHVARLQKDPVDAARLDRIKSHLRYQFALGLNSPSAVGFQAGAAINLTGGVESINELYAQYQKVTPADVQRLAREIFRPANQTVVTLSYPSSPQPAAKGGQR